MFAFRCFCDLWFVFWLICAVTEWLCSWNGQLIVGRFIYWGSWWRRQSDREAGRQAGRPERITIQIVFDWNIPRQPQSQSHTQHSTQVHQRFGDLGRFPGDNKHKPPLRTGWIRDLPNAVQTSIVHWFILHLRWSHSGHSLGAPLWQSDFPGRDPIDGI